jgi:hypothetical protein
MESYGDWVHWLGRASAAVLVVGWLALLLMETMSPGIDVNRGGIYQVFALAVVFAGYAIGWRKQLAGGLITIVGTITYFVVNRVTLGVFPSIEAVWFAVPGLLYLLASYTDKVGGRARATLP